MAGQTGALLSTVDTTQRVSGSCTGSIACCSGWRALNLAPPQPQPVRVSLLVRIPTRQTLLVVQGAAAWLAAFLLHAVPHKVSEGRSLLWQSTS